MYIATLLEAKTFGGINYDFLMKDILTKRILYVCSGDVSVYESQVLELLQYYIAYKHLDVRLIQGYSSSNEKINIEKKLANYPELMGRVIWLRFYPAYSVFEPLVLHSIKRVILSIPNIDQYTIHVRNEFTGYLVRKVFRSLHLTNKIIIDIRAIVLEELRYKLSSKRIALYRKVLIKIQKQYWQKFYQSFFDAQDDHLVISSVSSAINKYIQEKYPRCPALFVVNPNIAGKQFVYSEVDRIRVRGELGISQDALVAICATGSNATWQRDEDAINTLVNQGAVVINLSNNRLEIEGCITTKIPFLQMPAYLSAADIAVLWREHDFINWSASPSKLSEFAAMGLWIINNNSVANGIDYIQNTGAGHLVDDVMQIDLSQFVDSLREDRVSSGLKTFSVESIAESYVSLYE